MLSDEHLVALYTEAKGYMPTLAARLRAVAEAAVKDATSDWCVSDSVMAGRIMNVFGRSHDPSLEPAADPFRDKIAAMIYQHRTAVKDAGESVKPEEFHGWYCAHCQHGVDASDVTFHEQHTVCGRMIANDVPPRPQVSAAVPEDWREVMQGLVECARDEIVRCEGMKCREPNCISCNDELEATTSVERSREFVFRARAMLAASQPEVRNA